MYACCFCGAGGNVFLFVPMRVRDVFLLLQGNGMRGGECKWGKECGACAREMNAELGCCCREGRRGGCTGKLRIEGGGAECCCWDAML